MKKIMSLIIILIILSTFTGCGKNKEYTIGIVQIVEHGSLDTIRESIIEELEQQGYKDGDNIKIDYKNAQGDQSNLSTIVQGFVRDKVDLIVAIATPSAQVAAGLTTDIPIIFSAVTDPVGARLVEDLENPGGNITGTSDAIPVEEMFELAGTLTPKVEKFGFLYTASEANSKSVIEEAKTIAPAYGYTYEELAISELSELKQAVETLLARVDALYIPIDNTIASAMPVVTMAAREAKKPVYVGADSLVEEGGYATVGINYEQLGIQTAYMIIEVIEGADVATMPVQTLNQYYTVINRTTANEIGAKSEVEGAIIVD